MSCLDAARSSLTNVWQINFFLYSRDCFDTSQILLLLILNRLMKLRYISQMIYLSKQSYLETADMNQQKNHSRKQLNKSLK